MIRSTSCRRFLHGPTVTRPAFCHSHLVSHVASNVTRRLADSGASSYFRRWRLPWSRSRGPAPSPDSNYGFHTQTRQAETNADNAAGPYSVLNSQSSGPYSVLNTPNGPYTPSTASYSVLETPVPLWGPPPPYSDPNSPARRPQVADARPRMSKRIDNFDGNEGSTTGNRTPLDLVRRDDS